MGLASLLASTQASRDLAMARPTTSSERPSLYWSAVSMKLTPASRAKATMRSDAAASVGPPNVIVPRHSGETLSPLRPRLRDSMAAPPASLRDLSSPVPDEPHAARPSHLPALRHGFTLGENFAPPEPRLYETEEAPAHCLRRLARHRRARHPGADSGAARRRDRHRRHGTRRQRLHALRLRPRPFRHAA